MHAQVLRAQRDTSRLPIYKLRRCFLYNDIYYQLDMYRPPYHPRCKDLRILELYTAS